MPRADHDAARQADQTLIPASGGRRTAPRRRGTAAAPDRLQPAGEGAEAGSESFVAAAGPASFEPPEMKVWEKSRTIRAEVLHHLLVGELWAVAARGVRLRGVRVIGHLDLWAAKLRCPLSLDSCYLYGPPPALGFATVPLLEIKRCHLAGLAAESLVVTADLDLSKSTFTGPIQLEGADIRGQLNCCGARLEGKDDTGDALAADGLRVGGDLVLSKRFTAAGAIRLIGADITGQLNCCDARLTGRFRCCCAELNGRDKDGRALLADEITVGGGMTITEVSIINGAIHMVGADITGNLHCENVCLTGTDIKSNALVADSMTVGNGVTIYTVDVVAGAIRLPGAHITGRLRCGGAKLKGRDKPGGALLADGMTVSGGAWLSGVCTSSGAIRMVGADIKGNSIAKASA